MPRFAERLKGYMLKAVREAREQTDWLSPDTEYEAAIAGFIDYLFQAPEAGRFLADFRRFQRRVAQLGWLNSLSQLVLKATSPGVPDFYQGTELWDFSLVDPDNRRPVDYAMRSAMLDELLRQEERDRLALARRLVRSWSDGRVKLYTTLRLLRTRGGNPALFLEGEYLPLQASGVARGHVCAYARRHGGTWAVAIAPRLLAALVPPGALPLEAEGLGG